MIKRKRIQTQIEGTSRTKQSFKDDCDINKVIAKYYRTNQITHVNKLKGNYGDFTSVSDYHSALNAVMDAQERFLGLPSKIRAKFDNDPGKLLQFVLDDKNMDSALELGLLDQEKAAEYIESKKPKDPSPAS